MPQERPNKKEYPPELREKLRKWGAMEPGTGKMNYPEDLRAIFREWGRIGGKMGTREQKQRAGRISAVKRYGHKPRCPTCHQILKAEHPMHDSIKKATEAALGILDPKSRR